MSNAASNAFDCDEAADSDADLDAPRRVRVVVEDVSELLVLGTTRTPALLSAQDLQHGEEVKRLTL
jgi:hypothetical protein